jgi:hypothetical protein
VTYTMSFKKDTSELYYWLLITKICCKICCECFCIFRYLLEQHQHLS